MLKRWNFLKTGFYEGIKITYSRNGSAAESETLFGVSDHELVERVRALDIQQYSVGRTNLEDIYLALTGEKEGLGGDSN